MTRTYLTRVWKGNFVNVLRTIPTKSIQFAAFDGFKEVFKQTNPKTGERTLPFWGGSVSGALAGVVSTSKFVPLYCATRLLMRFRASSRDSPARDGANAAGCWLVPWRCRLRCVACSFYRLI